MSVMSIGIIGVLLTGIAILITLIVALINFAVKFTRLESKVENIDDRLKTVENDVSSIKFQLAVVSGSPLRLSKRGQDIIDKINGNEKINKIKEEIIKEVKELSYSRKPFDIQNASFKAIENNLEKILSDDDKEVLFNIGADDKQIVNALGLLLRDKVLSS